MAPAKKKASTEAKIERSIERTFEKKANKCNTSSCNTTGGCIYFLGLIGALVYYISTSTGFWNGVLGVLKAIVWPAMVVFKLLAM